MSKKSGQIPLVVVGSGWSGQQKNDFKKTLNCDIRKKVDICWFDGDLCDLARYVEDLNCHYCARPIFLSAQSSSNGTATALTALAKDSYRQFLTNASSTNLLQFGGVTFLQRGATQVRNDVYYNDKAQDGQKTIHISKGTAASFDSNVFSADAANYARPATGANRQLPAEVAEVAAATAGSFVQTNDGGAILQATFRNNAADALNVSDVPLTSVQGLFPDATIKVHAGAGLNGTDLLEVRDAGGALVTYYIHKAATPVILQSALYLSDDDVNWTFNPPVSVAGGLNDVHASGNLRLC